MRSHPCDPRYVADVWASELPVDEALADMREYPDLYYCDHVQLSKERKTLPLSEQAWRRACQAA